MGKYFCENLVAKKDALRLSYICKKTNKICARVDYGYNGAAVPDKHFTLKKCFLLLDKDSNIKKEDKSIEEDKTVIEQPSQEEIVSEVKVEEQPKTEQVVKKPQVKKTNNNNRKKKTTTKKD